jgi:hypothetical protein
MGLSTARPVPIAKKKAMAIARISRGNISPAASNSLLADEVGLGKTIQAIAAIRLLNAEAAQTSLIVVPAGLVRQWRRQYGRGAVESVADARMCLLRATRASALISRSGHHMVQDSWDIVVIDEAGLPYSRLNISSITALAAAAPISFLTSPQRPKLVPHAGQMTRVSSLVDSTGAGIAWPHLVHLSVASASLMFASLA